MLKDIKNLIWVLPFFILLIVSHKFLLRKVDNTDTVCEDNLKVIYNLTLQLKEANRGSHMVASRMYGDTIYLPVSSQEEIDNISDEIIFEIEKELNK